MFAARAQDLREELLCKKPQFHGHELKHFAAPPYQVTLEVLFCLARGMQLIALVGGWNQVFEDSCETLLL